MGTGAEMRPASVSGIVTEHAPVADQPLANFFSLSLGTVPEVFAKVNSFIRTVWWLKNEMGTGHEMRPVIVSGIVTEHAQVAGQLLVNFFRCP